MASLRYIGLACLSVVLSIGYALAAYRQSPELPVLTPPVSYEGVYSRDNNNYQVFLHLGVAQGFVLREALTLPNGKVSSWEITGRWHQIRDNSFLQLTNKKGLYRIFNVGGSANLYLGMHLPTGRQITVPLYPVGTDSFEHAMSGILHNSEGRLVFENGDSGVVYGVLQNNSIKSFLKKHVPNEIPPPMAVRVCGTAVVDQKGVPALRIKSIQSISEEKTWAAQNMPWYFLDAVAGNAWLITRIGMENPSSFYVISFLPEQGRKGGKLEIFDGSRHTAGTYFLQGARLTLNGETVDETLGALFQRTCSWQLSGEVLELWDEKQLLAILEKARW